MDSEFGEISFDSEKVTQLIEKNKINVESIVEIAQTRKTSGIRNIYQKIKEVIINRGKEHGEDTRDK